MSVIEHRSGAQQRSIVMINKNVISYDLRVSNKNIEDFTKLCRISQECCILS